MKRRVLITLLCLLTFICQKSIAQQGVLKFSFQNVPLKTVLESIEQQTNLKFVYSANLVDVNQKVSISSFEETVSNVLKRLFEGRKIDYLIKGDQVILTPCKDESPNQEKIVVEGVVKDSKNSIIPYVSVLEEGTSNFTMANEKGLFSIRVSPKSRLVFSFMGYDNAVIPVESRKRIDVLMREKSIEIDELVVVGFGEQKRVSISASVSSISSSEITQSPIANISNALSGRLPGLTTIQSSGQPGDDAANLFIRGRGSWNNSSPLFVIDGVERDSKMFSYMDPSEIESFTLLKDASATAVYGSKGANGVILINTKRGREGKTQISFNASTTLQQFTRFPKYLNSYESLKLYNEALMNDGNDPLYSEEELEHYRLQDDPYRYPNTDWYALMLKKVAPQYNVSMNIRGGSRTVKYFISGSYMKQDGHLKTIPNRIYDPQFAFERYRVLCNVDAIITKSFTLSLEMSGNLNNRHDPYSQLDVFYRMNRMPPWVMPALNPDGSYTGTSEYTGANPYYMLNTKGSDQRIRYGINTAVKAGFLLDKLLKGLSLNARIAFDSEYGSGKYWTETQSTYKLISRSGRADRYTSFLTPVFFAPSTSTGEVATNRLDCLADIRYNRTFNNHNISAMALANISTYHVGSEIPYNSVSFVTRINYSYMRKYYIEANASYRGSENFAPGKRFGLFPSLSAGWNIHEENFMKKFSFINNLKLRASYGVTGNDYASERFIYKEGKWETSTTGGAYFGPKGGVQRGISTEPMIANPLATWETAKQINLGLDLILFNHSLGITFDKFYEKRDGILQEPRSVPSILGIAVPTMNIGKTQRDGWELEASYRNQIGNIFKYYFKGNISFVKNKIVFRDEPESLEIWRKQEGKPIGQQFGYVVLGFFKDWEDINNSPKQQVGTAPIPGDLKYLDYNGDGVVNDYDRVPIGYPNMPRYTYGFSFGFNVKNFDFNLHFQGGLQSSVFIRDYLMYEFYNRGKVQDIHLGRWTPETADTATYPALHVGATSQNHINNTFFLKDNSYLRLKTIEVAYTFNNRLLSKAGLQGLRVYLSGVNLFTWDKLKVVDPETPNDSWGNMYPQSKNFSLGVNINF